MNAHKSLKLVHLYIQEALSQLDARRLHEVRKNLEDARIELTKLLGVQLKPQDPEGMTQQEFTKMIHVKGSMKIQ